MRKLVTVNGISNSPSSIAACIPAADIKAAFDRPPLLNLSPPIAIYGAGSGNLRTRNLYSPIFLPFAETEIVTGFPTDVGRATNLPPPREINEPPDIEACISF